MRYLLNATLLALIVCPSLSAQVDDIQGGHSSLDRERQMPRKSLEQSLDYLRALREKNASLPHNPGIVDSYLSSIEAELAGNIGQAASLRLQAYEESVSEGGRTLWNVLRTGHSKFPGQIISLIVRGDAGSFKRKIRKLDEVSRKLPDSTEIQAVVVNTMLERMSYDAVLRYCNERIASGEESYCILKLELLLLLERKNVVDDLIEIYERRIRVQSATDTSNDEFQSDDSIHEMALQNFYDGYEPSLVELRYTTEILSSIQADSKPTLAKLAQHCLILTQLYAITNSHEEVIIAFMEGAESRIRDWRTDEQTEIGRQRWESRKEKAIQSVKSNLSRVRDMSKFYRERHGKLSSQEVPPPSLLSVSLHGRYGVEKSLVGEGGEMRYLSLEEVFGAV